MSARRARRWARFARARARAASLRAPSRPAAPVPPPPAAAAAAPAQPPPLPALDPAALLEHLAGRDAILPDALLQRFGGQRGCLAFYEKFLRSPVLASFMATRRLAAEEHQRQEWAAAAETARAPVRELLAVEHFFRLERQLAAARVQAATSAEGGEHAAATAAAIEQLAAQLQAALGGLPSDLQDAIRATPSHAALLGASAPEAAAPARV